jgi:iron complex outermembrane receptor protein
VKSDGYSPRVILTYNVNKKVQFTAQASRGFRLGGINDPLNVDLVLGRRTWLPYSGFENWDDENVTNYELGTKTRLADGRVTFNASVFMTKIDGLQVIADAGTCSSRIVINADAENARRGIRAVRAAQRELGSRPSATWVKAEITKSSGRSTGLWPVSVTAISCPPRPSCRPSAPRPTTGPLATDSRATCASPCSTLARRSRNSATRSRTSA